VSLRSERRKDEAADLERAVRSLQDDASRLAGAINSGNLIGHGVSRLARAYHVLVQRAPETMSPDDWNEISGAWVDLQTAAADVQVSTGGGAVARATLAVDRFVDLVTLNVPVVSLRKIRLRRVHRALVSLNRNSAKLTRH
jgi:hypothetical protein